MSVAVLVGGAPRYPRRSAEPRISFTISEASLSVIGATRTDTSRRTSTATPPSPRRTTGPNRVSRDMPTIVSIPPATMGSTVTPSNRAFGSAFKTDALISIDTYRADLAAWLGRPIDHHLAVAGWYDALYLPVIAALRRHVSQTAHMTELEPMLRGWAGRMAEAGGLPEGRLAEAFNVYATG